LGGLLGGMCAMLRNSGASWGAKAWDVIQKTHQDVILIEWRMTMFLDIIDGTEAQNDQNGNSVKIGRIRWETRSLQVGLTWV
jgi:hypothetical protein